MRVERLQREFAIEVIWWPFELHPEIPSAGIDRREAPSPQRVAMYEHLRSLAVEAGLPFQRPPRVVNSHRALEAAEFAREQGKFDAYHRALFDAYWAQGRDIGDAAVLVELAVAAGLDGGALRDALESRRYATLVGERTEEARAWGVTGTPTFIFESGDRRFPLVGAQDDAVFENVARRLGSGEEPRSWNREHRTQDPPGSRF